MLIVGKIAGKTKRLPAPKWSDTPVILGRWDRNRTCNLRFWSPRRPIHSHLAEFTLSILACICADFGSYPSKAVEAFCSQFCSQRARGGGPGPNATSHRVAKVRAACSKVCPCQPPHDRQPVKSWLLAYRRT